MNILQICYAYPPSFSGYGKQLKTLNSFLCKTNSIRIITAFDGTRDIASSELVHAVFKRPRTYYRNKSLNFYLFCLIYPFKFFREFLKADVIHVIKAGPEIIPALIICKLLNKKIIVKVAQDEIEGKKSILTKIRLNLIPKVDSLIAISERIHKNALEIGMASHKISRISNCVDTNFFKPVGVKSIVGPRKFLYIGSICMRKGVQDLIDAIQLLPKNTSAEFSFIGPDYNEIKEINFKLDEISRTTALKCQYFGEQTDIRQFLNDAHFLILPSHSEGMPNVVLEALASGTPVIVSDIDIHKEIVSNDIGMIHLTRNPIDLAKNLLNAIDVSNLEYIKLSENCRVSALKNYSIKYVSNCYENLYRKLTK